MNGYAPAYEGKGEAYAAARQMVPTRADTTNVPHIEDEVEVKIFGKENSQEFEKIDDSQKTDQIKYVPFPVKGFENTPPYQKTDEVKYNPFPVKGFENTPPYKGNTETTSSDEDVDKAFAAFADYFIRAVDGTWANSGSSVSPSS